MNAEVAQYFLETQSKFILSKILATDLGGFLNLFLKYHICAPVNDSDTALVHP